MSLQPTATVRQCEGQASRVTGGEALLVLIEQRKLHRLNAVGTRVWELSDGRSVSAIVATIVDEFEVDSPAATQDVCEFIEDMVRLGALVVSEPEA
jgi:hypothetical protein